MHEKILTGIIKKDNEVVTFVCDDFKFTFVRAGSNSGPIRLPLTITVDSAGYIWGMTNDDKQIAIFTKQNLVIDHTYVLTTWNYLIFTIPVINRNALFNDICFINGSIKSINPCNTLIRESDIEDELDKKYQSRYYVYKVCSSTKKIDIEIGKDKTTWIFGNMVNYKVSINEGTSLTDGKSVLEVEFNSLQSLTTLYDYYGYVSTLASFMTYRANVSFENVTLIKKNDTGSINKVADCHIKVIGNIRAREMMDSISVRFLSDNSFRNIVLNIAQVDKKHKYLPVEFLPKDDKDVGVLTKDKLRHICSALEVEMDLAKICASKDDDLNKLIEKVKNLIKASQDDSESHIQEKTYNNIFNSIGHWGDSVSDRAIIAWDMYVDEITPLMNFWQINHSADEIHSNIAKFVNVRNKITHEGFNELDYNLAETAIILSALVYCMAMSRLGIEKEKIKDLMGRRLIG